MLNIGTIEDSQSVVFNNKIDLYRVDASRQLESASKSQFGQFLTPASIASFMASLFNETKHQKVRLLDAGAGIGSLTAAFITELSGRQKYPHHIHVAAYEIDTLLFEYLNTMLLDCQAICSSKNINLTTDITQKDFIDEATSLISEALLNSKHHETFTHAILNPPYKKIRGDSKHRSLLTRADIEATNLYSAFVSLAIDLLEPGGELVAITPRSFCNGPYFKQFRKHLLTKASVRQIHVFESRTEAFREDEVLQENIIFHCVKGGNQRKVCLTSSFGSHFEDITCREVDYSDIVRKDDPDSIIYIPTSELDQRVLEQISCFQCSLDDLNIQVSTGRVVDFRCRESLCARPNPDTIPLIYPCHMKDGFIQWPAENSKKANAIIHNSRLEKLFFPNGRYVVVNRFSPKEGKKRINAALFRPETTGSSGVAFENHLNVFHVQGEGVSEDVAKGLLIYLNASLVDIFFRQFNGHTQVNATDLRTLPYPNRKQLLRMGQHVKNKLPIQDEIDEIVEKEVLLMAKKKTGSPVKAKKKIADAIDILKLLGFPREQQNDRSALTLLALLQLKPNAKWAAAKAISIGITPIMEFCSEYYGTSYKPNTRETFRRQTMHQFVQAGLVIENPDEPGRPVNSPKWCYQIESNALTLLQHYGSKEWNDLLDDYISKQKTLKQTYAKHRKMLMIPVSVSKHEKITLSPGKHNELIKSIIEEFAPRFTPGAQVVYVGDTAEKWGYYDKSILESMGVHLDSHGKMPDVVLYYKEKGWLILVEAVTSHGPVDGKRQAELCRMFDAVKDTLVFVTAFPTRAIMASYLNIISWETEVWVADAPSHLIHFNGERFLGPYANK